MLKNERERWMMTFMTTTEGNSIFSGDHGVAGNNGGSSDNGGSGTHND